MDLNGLTHQPEYYRTPWMNGTNLINFELYILICICRLQGSMLLFHLSIIIDLHPCIWFWELCYDYSKTYDESTINNVLMKMHK